MIIHYKSCGGNFVKEEIRSAVFFDGYLECHRSKNNKYITHPIFEVAFEDIVDITNN